MRNNHLSQDSQAWRALLLEKALWIVAFAAFPILVLASLTTSWPVFLLYLAGYLTILAVTIFPLPFTFRVWTAIGISFLVAVGNFLEDDFLLGIMTLMVTNALATLWIGLRAGIFMTSIGFVTAILFAWIELRAKEFASPWMFIYAIRLYSLGYLTFLLVFSASQIVGYLNKLFSLTSLQKEELKQLRDSLEVQVAERTAELERRARFLRMVSEVMRQISTERELPSLLSLATRLIRQKFGFSYVGIFLLDETRRYAILQAHASEEGMQGVGSEEGHRIEIASNVLFEQLVTRKNPILAQQEHFLILVPETRAELLLPLLSRGEVVGVLDMHAKDPQAFLPEEVEIFQGLADAIALGIENAQLLSEMQITLQQLQAVSGAEVRQAWRKFAARRRLGYRYTPLGLYPLEKSVLSDGREGLEIPLRLRGQTIGVLRLKRKATGQPWSEQEQTLAQQVAEQVALALENARLLEQIREQAERERILAEITARVRETLDMETILRRAADETRIAFALPEVFIQILPEETLEHAEMTTGEKP